MTSWANNAQTHKISIAQLTSNYRSTYNDRPAPIMRNHISWEDQSNRENDKRRSRIDDRSKSKVKRRKIFQQHTSPQHTQKVQPFSVRPNTHVGQESILRRVKSNGQLPRKVQFQPVSETIDSRLAEINKQLNSRKESRMLNQFSSASFRESSPREQSPQWLNLEQKLNESTQMLKKHEETISKKLPIFEKKLEANNRAISNLKNKFQQSNLQLNSSLKHSQLREDELSKMNSSLLMRECELMENKEQNKRKELELMRIKRIQNLQKGNLQLYKALEKGTFSHFQNLREEDTNEEMVNNVVWDDEQPRNIKFSRQQESTIRWEPNHQDLSVNNTIGEILSPLVLSEYQYCI